MLMDNDVQERQWAEEANDKWQTGYVAIGGMFLRVDREARYSHALSDRPHHRSITEVLRNAEDIYM